MLVQPWLTQLLAPTQPPWESISLTRAFSPGSVSPMTVVLVVPSLTSRIRTTDPPQLNMLIIGLSYPRSGSWLGGAGNAQLPAKGLIPLLPELQVVPQTLQDHGPVTPM